MSAIKQDPEYLFYVGATFTVEWYRDPAGRMPAKEYYENLSEEEQERLDDLAARLADSPLGTRLPRPLYNAEDSENKIYAFKPKDLRVLKAAASARQDYLIRVQGGTYYERIA